MSLFSPEKTSLQNLGFHLSRWNLSFLEKSLEKEYQKYFLKKNLGVIRRLFLVAFVFYALFGILDGLLLPHMKDVLWLVRYGVVVPLAGIAYGLTYTSFFTRYYSLVLSGIVFIVGLSTIFITLISPSPISDSYYAGIILVLVFGYTFMRIRFVYATVVGTLLVLTYEIIILFIVSTPAHIFINNTFFFVVSNLIGMSLAYYLELFDRRDFFMDRLYKKEQKKVLKMNQNLEEKVEERSLELKRKNKELAQKNKELEKQDKVKDDFIDIVSHEFRTPLTVIKGYVSLLQSQFTDHCPSDAKKYINIIFENNNRLSKMVNDILSLSRIKSGKDPVRWEEISIRDFGAKVLQEVSLLAKEKDISLVLSSSPDIRFLTDKDKLHIILINLLSNAIHHIPVKKSVEINWQTKTIKKEKGILISIRDTGDGIEKEQQKNIFEKFYQAGNARTRNKNGCGLGLSIVKLMTQRLGGQVFLESEKGEGTTFFLFLPLKKTKKKVS